MILILGIFSFSVGSVAAISPGSDSSRPMVMTDGPFDHAMEHQNMSEDMNDCQDMDCNDCDMAACSLGACSAALFHETRAFDAIKVSIVNAPGAPPALVGLERQYLPLPPP